MPKKRPTPRRPEPEPALEITERDYVMARLAAARVGIVDALAAIDEAVALYVHPVEDKSGKHRKEHIETALEALGDASRAVEAADEVAGDVDPSEGEPWDGEDEEDDEPEDDEDDEGDDDREGDED